MDPLLSLDKAGPPTNSFFCINGSRAQALFGVSGTTGCTSSPVGSVVPRFMKINKPSQNFDSVHQYDLPGKFGQAWTTPEQPHCHLQHNTKIRRSSTRSSSAGAKRLCDISARTASIFDLKSFTCSPWASFASLYQVLALNSVTITSRCAIPIILTRGAHPVGGVQMVIMPLLLTTTVDLQSETCFIIVR